MGLLARIIQWIRAMPEPESQEQRIQRLLDGLSSEDGIACERAQHALSQIALNRDLDYSPEYTILVLDALAEKTDLRHVDWILRQVEFLSKPSIVSTATAPVREAAQRCIRRIRERTEPGYLSQTLLHTASPPTLPGKELLRPAQGVAETAADTLLRGSRTNGSDALKDEGIEP